jgi:acyl-CoA reductase-like NAD-dependent aldehyde dehydrogenase
MQVINTLVEDAKAKGATVMCGGEIRKIGAGTFYPPTILTGLTDDMRIVKEEVFGPVMLIFKVKGEKEAIELANSIEFGLQSSVITRDAARGERIAAQLEAGATCINDFGLCYMNQNVPFGGVKYSGFGVMNGRDGLRAYTCPKAVLSDRFPVEIPPKLFPVKPVDYEVAKSSAYLLFAPGLGVKIKHLLRVIGLSIKG